MVLLCIIAIYIEITITFFFFLFFFPQMMITHSVSFHLFLALKNPAHSHNGVRPLLYVLKLALVSPQLFLQDQLSTGPVTDVGATNQNDEARSRP